MTDLSPCRRAVEQRDSRFLPQTFYLVANRGLRQVQHLGCARNAAFAGDSHKRQDAVNIRETIHIKISNITVWHLSLAFFKAVPQKSLKFAFWEGPWPERRAYACTAKHN